MPSGNKNGLAALTGQGVSFLTQNRAPPYSKQWSGGVQQSLPGKIRLELQFVRMLSLKGIESFNLNEPPDMTDAGHPACRCPDDGAVHLRHSGQAVQRIRSNRVPKYRRPSS